MFLIILNSRKSRIRNIFLHLVAVSILWTGGSTLMRYQILPSYQFWYHVSLFGILFMPMMYYWFIIDFVGSKRRTWWYASIIILIGYILNITNGLFIPPPVIKTIDSQEIMIYETIGKSIYILIVLVGAIIIDMLYVLYKGLRKQPSLKRSSKPIIFGIAILFFGNILVIFPTFSGFPIDIVSGLVNAFALLYLLVKRSPFKLKMFYKGSVGYMICIALAMMSLFVLNPLIIGLINYFQEMVSVDILWYLFIFIVVLAFYYIIWRLVVMGVFVRDEENKLVKINEFGSNALKTLDINEINKQVIEIIEDVTGSHDIYIALRNPEGDYQINYSNRMLADISSVFRKDNPLILSMLEDHSIIDLEEFSLHDNYHTMWEEEKYELYRMKVQYAIGLVSADTIYGFLLVSDEHSKRKLNYDKKVKLQSITTMASIAYKNAISYEKAIIEARTDDLTGVYDRKYFYEVINEQFEDQSVDSMALVLLNIDDFKMYNQLYGMTKSDNALCSIAAAIDSIVGEKGVVSRFSGKEFMIILPNTNVHSTLEIIDAIKAKVKEGATSAVKKFEMLLTFSTGVCVYPYGASSVNELIENVQQAVYKVKRNGKNAVEIFDTFLKGEEKDEGRSYDSIYNEYKSTIFALTAAIDAKDHYTFSHSENVANYALALANELNLNSDIQENIRQAALLHDIGKIAIPEEILNKPTRLNSEEYEIIKGHVDASINIIRHLPSLDYVIPAVLGHHERYDGGGYPRGTKGEDIPLTARILCLADSFDAMYSRRVYKKSYPLEKVIRIITEEAGKQFDPNLAYIFVEMLKAEKIDLSKSQ